MERKIPFAIGEHYHIYNRGVEKRVVFQNDVDHQRFILLLLLANSMAPVRIANTMRNYSEQGRSLLKVFNDEIPEERLVDVLAYCLMPNHFHVVLRERTEGGISKFMGKVMTGYSMYFNKKYGRSGVLFQGRFQAKHIDEDAYLRHIFAYVHLNPVDLYTSGWKESGRVNRKYAIEFLKTYRYSSFADYFQKERPERNILSGTDELPWKEDNKHPEFLFDFYDPPEDHSL